MAENSKLRESLTIRLRPQDVQRIETIRKTLGIQSHTEVIRHALKRTAEAAEPVSRETAAEAPDSLAGVSS